MRIQTPFVWLAILFAACIGLSTVPALAQFQIVAGPTIECLESGVPNDTIDAPEDSVRITVSMTGDEQFCDEVQLIFNPSPGFGVLPVVPTTYACPTGDITGYPMTITEVLHNNPSPGLCRMTGTITFRPENICISIGDTITFDLAGRGVDLGTPPPGNVQCGQFTRFPISECNICIGCGFILYAEACGFYNDGIIAIGDTVWLDPAVAALYDSGAGDTVFANFENLACNAQAAFTPADSQIIVGECGELENNMNCDTVLVIRATWNAAGGDEFGDASTDYDTLSYCSRPADNLRPELDTDCLDSMTVINGNYICNDTLAGCFDTLRFYFSPGPDGSCPGTNTTLACGADTFANFDVVYVGLYWGDFADCDTFPANSDAHCISGVTGVGGEDSLVWLSGTYSGNGEVFWADVPINDSLWCQIQQCLSTGDEVWAWFIDDAGNSSEPPVEVQAFTNFDEICLDNVPPPGPFEEVYFDDAVGVCNKRFSPFDSALATNYTNISPDSIRWYLDKVWEEDGVDDEEWDDVFNDVYLIGFDVRQEPDENNDTTYGAIIGWLDWIAPGAPEAYIYPNCDTVDLAWNWRDLDPADPSDSACFTWYGKRTADSLDAALSTISPCPYGALVGITHARYLDMAGCNGVFGSDHDGVTDILDGYTTLNQLHAVVDTCKPTFVTTGDSLHFNPPLPAGAPWGPYPTTYLWEGQNGIDDDPVFEFRARRWFTQGITDTCLKEWLHYRVRLDTVDLLCPWTGTVNDTAIWYSHEDPVTGTNNPGLWSPVTFYVNSFLADTTSFEWGHRLPTGGFLPDGLWRATLELKDNAGNVCRVPRYIWINGQGPKIDSLIVTMDSTTSVPNCNLNFNVDDRLCVWLVTDSTADSVLVDWSCIPNMPAEMAQTWLTTWTTSGDQKIWEACIYVQDYMIDTTDAARNVYETADLDDDFDCINDDCGNYIIGVQAWDDGLYTAPDCDDVFPCDMAILGLTPCPRIVNIPQYFYFYDPDSARATNGGIFGPADTNYIDTEFIDWEPMPLWNAISPGSIDSMGGAGSYDAILNPANDEVQDSVFVRILLDLSSIDAGDVIGGPLSDTLVLQFVNEMGTPGFPADDRIREVRKALFYPTDNNLGPDPANDNTIHDGFLELDDLDPANFAEFRYYWNATWFTDAGEDSVMLVRWNQQDTIIVRAFTINGDSIVATNPDTVYQICDTLILDSMDIDNENPRYYNWTGILGRDYYTGTTSSVLNLGVDGDCGRRYTDGEPFSIRVKVSELVHYDSAAYPNADGSQYPWVITRDWQISPVDRNTGLLVPGVDVWIETVEDSIINTDSVYYTINGYFDLPDDWEGIEEVCMVIRGAWDQAGNPGRYNDPVWTDAYENDSFEDTTWCVFLLDCDPWAAGCPNVWGRPDGVGVPDSVLGWIAAEEDSVIVCATIIETCELALCPPGSPNALPVDSVHILEGDFQRITDDPNPWVLWNERGEWFIFIDENGDSLGWARNYYWYLRADSADLATIHCDGDFLRFDLHVTTYGGVDDVAIFPSCVQVDVNEPRWDVALQVYDSSGYPLGGALSELWDDRTAYNEFGTPYGSYPSGNCISPNQPVWIYNQLRDEVSDFISCGNSPGVGVDTSQIWADFSNLYMNADSDSVRCDTMFYQAGWWYCGWHVSDIADAYNCLADTFAIFRLHAGHDSLGHHDRELFWQDTLFFCNDCMPPEVVGNVFCDCDSMFDWIELVNDEEEACPNLGLQYVHPGGQVNLLLCVTDPNTDSSMGLSTDNSYYEIDLSQFDASYGWVQASEVYDYLDDEPITQVMVQVGGGVCDDEWSSYFLNETYDNGTTLSVRYRVCDVSGNCTDTSAWIPVAIVDTLRAIVDFVYTIGDDSIRAYVTPGDEHVNVWAMINGYAADLVSEPNRVWANFSSFWCDSIDKADWDTVYADFVGEGRLVDGVGFVAAETDTFFAYWGWYPGVLYADDDDTTSFLSTHIPVDADICGCGNESVEGHADTIWFHVEDAACNVTSPFSVFEFSGCDTTVPDVDSVWVMGASEDCAPGWIRGAVGDTIEVWAWLDSLFNGFEDTLRIDSMMADLRGFGALYNWTEITPDPNRIGGAPCYGWEPDWSEAVPSEWDTVRDCDNRLRLVAKWYVINDLLFSCADVAWVPVKSQRQTGLNGSHGYYLDMTYGSAEAFTATYDWSVVWGDFTHVTGFPADPDSNGIDSVLVLGNSVYGLDWDSLITVSVLMNENCIDGGEDCNFDWYNTWIDFSGFLDTAVQYVDTVYCNVDGNNTDSLVWYIPLFDPNGGGAVYDETIISDQYWFPLWLSDYTACGNDSFVTQYCLWEDLDSVIYITIQNWNQPLNGMILICDSLTTVCDPALGDLYNMDLWNLENAFNGISSPDAERENLYKVYTDGSNWRWFSHEDVNTTRFFVFVEDSVLQCDNVDNDHDGLVDEVGEGVDFYTADLRINTMPQVAHVDSMNVDGVWINYLWYADNFSEHEYQVDLFISDIYGHRDTLECENHALVFWEDETCPRPEDLGVYLNGERTTIRVNNTYFDGSDLDLGDLTADDSIFVFANFDSIQLWIDDRWIFDEPGSPGSGVDLSINTDPDSSQFNGDAASTIRLIGPDLNDVAGFTQTFYDPYEYFREGPLTLSRGVDDVLEDGWYTIEITTLDRMGNSCVRSWQFRLDQTCPEIVEAFASRPGQNSAEDSLWSSWDYVELIAHVEDELDGVDSVIFEYAFDANRDGNVDAFSFWQTANILGANGGANWDTEYPYAAYWNIRNLPWSSEDTLGLPPVNPDGSCTNTYFVRTRAKDIYGHECMDTFTVHITDDIGPVAGIFAFDDYDFNYGPDNRPQGSLVACFNPNTMTDSTLHVCAWDLISPVWDYDPLPGDSFTNSLRWFDAYEGMMQYKFWEAPNVYTPGNTDPSAGWIVVRSGVFNGGQDTIVARDDVLQDWCVNLNMAELTRQMQAAGETAHQFNIRFVAFDVCGNSDELNTPVATFRVECDTTAPLAVICYPEPDMCVTNYRCDSTVWVPVKASVPIFSDVDSLAFFFVDSLSQYPNAVHTFISGTTTPDSVDPGFAEYYGAVWNTANLLSGTYWLYAVAYDEGGLYDTSPLWQPVFVDNTPPQVPTCWVADPDDENEFNVLTSTWEDSTFTLRATATDNGCGITGVQFQYLDRYGNWRDLEDDEDAFWVHGSPDIEVWPDDGFDDTPSAEEYYEVVVTFRDFGNSPLDSMRFRAYAIDDVDYGDNNWGGDLNRDCNVDRDQECDDPDHAVCCMALEIRDRIPFGTNVTCWNHGVFAWALPQFAESYIISDGQIFSTCNSMNPLDTLIVTATVHDSVEDGWLMHFKYRRSAPEGFETDWEYIPNDQALNPAIPALGPIPLINTWDSVYVVWSGVRGFIEAADDAAGIWWSQWEVAAYVSDVTGNEEAVNPGQNNCELNFVCMPKAPITAVSYVQNDVENPENRVRTYREVDWSPATEDTIEVIYNRISGYEDPDAFVLFYTDEDAIRNCRGDLVEPFNVRLWNLETGDTIETEFCWNSGDTVLFEGVQNALGWDQFPPDSVNSGQYAVGLYINNNWAPGVYNFAMVLTTNELPFAEDGVSEADYNLDQFVNEGELTCIDLVVRVVNVNEPQVVFCTPEYGDHCGATGYTPISADLVPDPYFFGVLDTVWFEMSQDGINWSPVVDPVTEESYDANPDTFEMRFEIDERDVPGMAGWYYWYAGTNDNPVYDWYAERDLFPDVALYIWELDEFYPMTGNGSGHWTVDVELPHDSTGTTCYTYSFVIDANDNNIWEEDGIDRWVDDPHAESCEEDQIVGGPQNWLISSEICFCPWAINFDSRAVADGSYLFRTVVGWHDDVAYHVIENPSYGDSLHVFFVDNTIVEGEGTPAVHDIEFDRFYVPGGMMHNGQVCNPADTVFFVTDIQTVNGDLVVEDICKVTYQVSLTRDPFADSSWTNVYTVYSNNDEGWIEGWPGYWIAYNPIADDIDNDGDGLVDETWDVQAGDGVGEENSMFWSRSVVLDYCGNYYYTNAESIWVDVSQPSACITEVNGNTSPDNSVVIIPDDRLVHIHATDSSYADQAILAVFQYRTLNPIGAWTNIQPAEESDDTVRHEGDQFHAIWDLLAYFNSDTVNHPDPEGWFQLRAVAIDTVGNDDLCDNVVCQITVRLNDGQPAARVELYQIYNSIDTAYSCTEPDICYIMPEDPYCITAIFAATNIDTGLASLTFQYQSIALGQEPSEWRNIETIYDELNYGSDGDTTTCVWFQPRPEEIGNHGFNIRVVVEDYNGNDTSAVKTLYVDGTPPDGSSDASPTIQVDTWCGDRCRLDNDAALITATFLPDEVSGEVNVDWATLSVWTVDSTWDEEDSLWQVTWTLVSNFGAHNWLVQDSVDAGTWTHDFGGDLCAFWNEHDIDMGCYYFWVTYEDCAGNRDSILVTTDCGFGETALVCIDCAPDLPDHASLDYMQYYGWDCASVGDIVNDVEQYTDDILDGTTEVGNQSVTICGELPDYQQYVWGVQLWVSSEEAGVPPTLVDSVYWEDTRESMGDSYCFQWNLTDTTDEGALVYPSGYYRVWVLAIDAICQQQDAGMADTFWVHVDNDEPDAWITQINGNAPNPDGPDVIEVTSGEDDPAWLWVEWTDGLTPDDSTQAHNQVQVWCKNMWHPNQADAWTLCGEIPSPCNMHYVLIDFSNIHCGDSLHIVAIAQDRWANGDLDVDRVVDAFDEGRYIDVTILDTTPPDVVLWALNWDDTPDCDEDAFVRFDQQTHGAHWSGAWGHDVWLHAFASTGDQTVSRVYFEYSLDGQTWFEIAVDDDPSSPDSWNCEECGEPEPWWCMLTDDDDHEILWTAYWDIAGLAGDIWVRVRGEDECGNFEEWDNYVVSIDVQAPVAQVFVWESEINVEDLPCFQWSEPQVGDSVERYTELTLGACPDTTNYDAYGVIWYIKRSADHPLEPWSWCYMADDSTGPFSALPLSEWTGGPFGTCPEVEPGTWYDIACLTNDLNGNQLTWTQLLNHGAGITWEEKWADLISRGFVKRFKAVDHTAPVAHSLTATPDQTPDSSVIFLTGNVNLSAIVEDIDVTQLTFAALEQGAPGPWTIIETLSGDSNDSFQPAEGYWNTELLNGTYRLGAFAEDFYGNMDGNPNAGESGAPQHPLLVNVDNQRPTAVITEVRRNGDVVTNLERGAVHTIAINADDNFGLRQVALYYRHSGGDPDNWILIGTDLNFPYSFNWQVPAELIPGWTYDFAAVATDLVYLTDMVDGQGNYVVDATWQVVDEEASIAITSIGGVDAETLPRLNGTNITVVAQSEPYLDYVRFVWVRGVDTTDIQTIQGSIGQTTWTLTGWDVTVISEGPAQLCAIGSADQGGEIVTLAHDCRNIVIDHTLSWQLSGNAPASHGLVGGECELNDFPTLDDVWVSFVTGQTDPGIDTIWFQWKWAEQPDSVTWSNIGQAVRDQQTGRWAYAADFTELSCGTITLRAMVSDNAVPQSNLAYITFADSVRVDNCDPIVDITNINGDVTPEDVQICQGQVAQIIATVLDPFENGGNSQIDSVCFYVVSYENGDYEDYETWQRLGCDGNGAPWEVFWNTGGFEFGEWELVAVAYDRAGNCGTTSTDVEIIDCLYQRAWIVGFDNDNGLGCMDKIWAVTDDCPPNYTVSVAFQYSINNGQSWVALGEVTEGSEWCDEWLDYHTWELQLEFDAIPAGAVFRALATDNRGNADPNPPRFLFSDVSTSASPVLFSQDWVRVPVQEGQVPWVFATLEDYTQTCITNGGLVCVEPVEGDPSRYAGPLPSNTLPCLLDNRDGQVTVFRTVTTNRAGNTFVLITSYEMNIHRVDQEGGSNGWLTSEDTYLRAFIPDNGVTGHGALWYQPAHDDSNASMIPPSQYYYSLLSEVETIYSSDFTNGSAATNFRFNFIPARLPANPQANQVVAVYWDASTQLWTEFGIFYGNRNLTQGWVEFSWIADWNVSVDGQCPDGVTMAVMYSQVPPIDRYVRLTDTGSCDVPDSTYYTPTRGPTTDCNPVFWAVLRQGEYSPPESDIDVWIDGIRIINDGVSTDCDVDGSTPIFSTSYDTTSGQYSWWFNSDANTCAPYFGCLGAGQHNVQVWAGNISTFLTPFWVDVTGPEAYSNPGYINHQVTLIADITDRESGIDTNNVQVVLFECDNWFGGEDIWLTGEAIHFTPIANGYQARVQVEWDILQTVFFGDWDYDYDDWFFLYGCPNPPRLCVEWHIQNKVCLDNDDTEYYAYTVDVEPPTVQPLSPTGAPIDDDGDGPANEDWRDCENNDNDFWYSDSCLCWLPRYDEDPINFAADTFNCGEKLTISAQINDLIMCCSGASQVDMRGFQLWIDGVRFGIADTANAQLNFHVFWPNGGADDAVFTWGGPQSGAAAAFAYTPGDHIITVNAADSVGNVGTPGFAWEYYVRCSGPSIVFAQQECGNWWRPDGVNEFAFWVRETVGAPIATNGISYRAYSLPDNLPVWQPTTVDPAGRDSVYVEFDPTGSFPIGQTALVVEVTADNIFHEEGMSDGRNVSSWVYTVDNCRPTIVPVSPDQGETFSRDVAIVIEVIYTDDCDNEGDSSGIGDGGGSTMSVGGNKHDKAQLRISTLDAMGNVTGMASGTLGSGDGGIDSHDRTGTLDDNGSGVIPETFDMNIYNPTGENVGPETNEDYAEGPDEVHAKFILPAGGMAGEYTVNAGISDCVGNRRTISWTFNILSSGPAITFNEVEGECRHENYWNPNGTLPLSAQVEELDDINVTRQDVRVDILRIYTCDTGLCTDTLLANANFNMSPNPDPVNTDQVFTISGEYNFDHDIAAVELRFVITASNRLGAVSTATQSWIVDGTPPTLEIVSPTPNTVVSGVVTISANFYDVEPGDSLAMLPGDVKFKLEPSIQQIGPQRNGKMKSAAFVPDKSLKAALGSWSDAVTQGRGGTALDGMSGVDPNCITMLLRPANGGEIDTLSNDVGHVIITDNNITWTGNLPDGSYTVILAVCDHVCNTASVNWNFAVNSSSEGGIVYLPPYYISSMPHTFDIRVNGESVDYASARLTVEGAVPDSTGYSWMVITGNASLTRTENTYHHNGNYDLGTYVAFRLTMNVNFVGGIPVPGGSQVYVVDQSAPRWTTVTPPPYTPEHPNVIEIGSSPTFIASFVEVGNTTIDAESVRLWLRNSSGVVIDSADQVVVDESGTSGYVMLQAPALAEGDYVLYGVVADVAGNSATMAWNYRVGSRTIIPIAGSEIYNYPNPFTPEDGHTTFNIPVTGVEGSADLEVKIYDWAGTFVATVYDGPYSPNCANCTVQWDATNSDGERVANGVYLAHVKVSAAGKAMNEIVKVAFKNAK